MDTDETQPWEGDSVAHALALPASSAVNKQIDDMAFPAVEPGYVTRQQQLALRDAVAAADEAVMGPADDDEVHDTTKSVKARPMKRKHKNHQMMAKANSKNKRLRDAEDEEPSVESVEDKCEDEVPPIPYKMSKTRSLVRKKKKNTQVSEGPSADPACEKATSKSSANDAEPAKARSSEPS